MPRDATRVIFHTAVIGYLSSVNERSAFVQTLRDLDVVWVSNEPPELLPDASQALAKPWPPGQFLLTMNGQSVAWTDPHGTTLDWIDDS